MTAIHRGAVKHRAGLRLIVVAVFGLLWATLLLGLLKSQPGLGAGLLLGSVVLFAFMKPEWSTLVYVLFASTLPVLAYGLAVDMGVSLRPHTMALASGLVAGLARSRFRKNPILTSELFIVGLLGVISVSWTLNGAPGILALLGPMLAWAVFLVTSRLGNRVELRHAIMVLASTAVLLALLAAVTVLFRSERLFYALFSQNAGTTLEALALSAAYVGGRGMYIRNGEGFLLVGFCLLMSVFLVSRKGWALAAVGAGVVAVRLFTVYGRAYFITYLVVVAVMIGGIAIVERAKRRVIAGRVVLLGVVVVSVAVGTQWMASALEGRSAPSELLQDLSDDWTLRWARFFAYDADLRNPYGSGGGTIVANREAADLFAPNPLWLFLGTAQRGRSVAPGSGAFHVDVSGPLGIMVVWGLSGLIMISGFVVSSARSALAVLRAPNMTDWDRSLAYGYLFSLAGFMIYSSLRFPGFVVDSDVAVLGLVAGLVEVARHRLATCASVEQQTAQSLSLLHRPSWMGQLRRSHGAGDAPGGCAGSQ